LQHFGGILVNFEKSQHLKKKYFQKIEPKNGKIRKIQHVLYFLPYRDLDGISCSSGLLLSASTS
jgi:hypothetical protein